MAASGALDALADWPVGDGKETEPEVLKAHLDELFAAWPSLRVLTGDALFCQRPLARAIVAAGRDYALAVKDNQPDMAEAMHAAFDRPPGPPDARTAEKRGRCSISGGCGSIATRPTTSASA